jgi:EmrB/QacA subfamily drug resistance transporter
VSAEPLGDPRRWRMLAVLSLSLLVIGLDNTVVNVALPTLQRHFHASASTLGWVVDAYLLVFAGLLLTAGTLGDRFGRKRALQAGLALFALSSAVVPLVTGAGALIALRALMGAGAALIMPATLSTISAVFPLEERGRAIGIWAATAGAGIGLGPLAGGLLLEHFAWSSVFLINVPIAALALVAGARLVPDSRDPCPGRLDPVGAGLSMAALLALLYAIIQAPERGWLHVLTLACFAAAAALGVAFVAWERRVEHPMLPLGLFRSPRFSVASLAIAFCHFGVLGMIFALTQYLQFAHGFSPLQAGAAMVPVALGMILGSDSGSRLAARLGTTRVVTAGLCGLVLTYASTLLWTPGLTYWAIGPTIFALSFTSGWVMAPATGSIMGAVPVGRAGVASAMNDVTRLTGGALGIAVVGSVITSIYASRVAGALDGLSPAARATARSSVGSARALADRLPGADGEALTAAAARAFTDALGLGLACAALLALMAAAIVAWRLPARHESAPRLEGVPAEPAQAGG